MVDALHVSTEESDPSPPDRQMDPSVPLSALTYFSLSCLPAEPLGCLTHGRCGDAVPAHTQLLSPGGKLTLPLRGGGGLQLSPLPSCDLFLPEANKHLKQLSSDHLDHADNCSPVLLYRMVISGQTGCIVWDDCWLRNPSVLSWISILPLPDIQEGDEFGKHLSYPARPLGVLEGDSEVQRTLKTAVISDTSWSKRPQGPQAVQSRGSQGKPVFCTGRNL